MLYATSPCYYQKMAKKYKAPLGASLVVVSSLFYASYGIWTKLMGNFFDGYTASALRSVLVLVILIPIAFAYRSLQPVELRRNWRYMGGMIIASLVTWGSLYYAILHAGVGISLTVAYASIVIGQFFFGWLFVRERFTRDKALSAVLGIVGLALIFAPTTKGLAVLALVAALASGLSSAANAVFAKKIHYNATQSTIVLWSASVVANFFMAAILHRPYPSVGLHIEWLWLILFAVASVIASWSLVRGVKLIDAGAAGVLGLLEIVFGVLFGVIFFGERPGLAALGGIVVIIAAAAIPYFKDYNAQKGTLE
jgi:drug/metabolite transporter (DMT)-like permease